MTGALLRRPKVVAPSPEPEPEPAPAGAPGPATAPEGGPGGPDPHAAFLGAPAQRPSGVAAASAPTVLRVVDVGSVNGTFVNDRSLAPGEPHPVVAGDTVRLGSDPALRLAVGDP
jgi:hypothetical protein